VPAGSVFHTSFTVPIKNQTPPRLRRAPSSNP
jgi:hypothetical protein